MSSTRSKIVQITLGVVAAALLTAVGVYQLQQGHLPSDHAQFLATVLSIQEGGELTPLLHHYPLLPLLIAVPLPAMETLLVGGTAAMGLLTAWVWARAPNRYLAGGVAALFLSPLGLELATKHVQSAVGLVLVYVALHHYRRWLKDDNTSRLFYISVSLAVAEYAVPLAFPLAIVLWMVQDVVRPTSPGIQLARGMALILPTALVVAGWLFVEKTLTGLTEWPVSDFAATPLPLGLSLAAAAPLFVGTLSYERIWPLKRGVIVFLSLPISLGFAATFGMTGSLALGTGFMVVGTLALWPSDSAMQVKRGVLVGVIAQVVVIWAVFFPETRSATEVKQTEMEQAIATTVKRAPAGQVLTDPRLTYRIIARMETARPFMTPSVSGYYIATLAPELFVKHVLMGPQLPTEYSSLWQKYHTRIPPRFHVSWSWSDYRLLTQNGAAPLYQ